MNESDVETREQTLRRHMLADIQTYRHALSMMKRKNVNQDSWDVAWWAANHLRQRIRNNIEWLGGLTGEW